MKEEAVVVAQEFVWHLHDETRWPAKYYKDVLYFLFDVMDGKKTLEDAPKTIHYSYCLKNYSVKKEG